MYHSCNRKFVFLIAISMLVTVVHPSPLRADGNEQRWDTRLNGIWKVTGYTVEGSRRKMDGIRFIFSDGLVVSASPESGSFLPAEAKEVPFGAPDFKVSPKPEGIGFGEQMDYDVSLIAYKATTQEKSPHCWIDLSTKWRDPQKAYFGLYQVDDTTLRLVLGKERPKSISPKSNGFTPSANAPRVWTMVRLTKVEPKDSANAEE